MMKIWIQSNRKVLFEIGYKHFVSFKVNQSYPFRNKRLRIRRVDVISLASSFHTVFPPNFVSMYYTEDLKYWHELWRLVETVCA